MKKAKLYSLTSKIGSPPGSLLYVGEKNPESPVSMDFIEYDLETAFEKTLNNTHEISHHLKSNKIKWININGIHKTNIIKNVGELFNIHKLHLEDVINALHRPKIDICDFYIFMTMKMISKDQEKRISFEHISFFLFESTIITFQEVKGDVFDLIRNRIRDDKGQVRQKGADYLFSLLIDAVVDQYFLVSENFNQSAEQLEDAIFELPNTDLLNQSRQLKKNLMIIRRAFSPLRDMLNKLINQDIDMVKPATTKYFADVQDSIIHIMDSIDTAKEALSNIMETYVSSLSIKMNNIMRILTIISTIFIPLTFIVGVYGMNFKFMPELSWKWGYPSVWGIMFILVVGMIVFFRKKDWL